MISTSPSSSFEARADGFDTGLAGTLGVQIIDGSGAVVLARTTSGIDEDPDGTGSYVVTLTAPATVGDYSVKWDDGSGVEAFEALSVTALTSTSTGGLVTVADLDARGVEYPGSAQAEAAIADASAVAREYVAPVFDAVEAPNAPATVVAIVIGMVRRVLTNPRGLQSETLGDYAFAAGANSVATLLPTQREKRMLRLAAAAYAKANDMDVPSWGASSTPMQVDLPAPPAYWDGIKLPSDQE